MILDTSIFDSLLNMAAESLVISLGAYGYAILLWLINLLLGFMPVA